MSVGVNVMLSLMSVISLPPDLCGLSARTVVYVGTLGVVDLDVLFELGFLNCDDVCMCVIDESFELLKFVVYAVYVNLQNDEISLVITARFMIACGIQRHSLAPPPKVQLRQVGDGTAPGCLILERQV